MATMMSAGDLCSKLAAASTEKRQYAFRNLPAHLAGGGRSEDLRRLLFDFTWLQSKLTIADTDAVIADYDYAKPDAELRHLQSAIRLSAHVLGQDRHRLAQQLIGRLLGHRAPNIQAMLKQAAAWNTQPWLRPLHPTLEPPGQRLIRTIPVEGRSVTDVAVTQDGLRAVLASFDPVLQIWDVEAGRLVGKLEGHKDNVHAVAVTLDGRRAVSASFRTTIVWDLEARVALNTLSSGFKPAVAVTDDGRRAICCSYDKTLQVLDLESGRELQALGGQEAAIDAVAVSPDGRRVISAASSAMSEPELRVWDLDTGRTRPTIRIRSHVESLAMTPDGRRAVLGYYNDAPQVLDLETGQILCTLSPGGFPLGVSCVAVTADGSRAVSSSNRTLRVWDLEGGTALAALRAHSQPITALSVTPDGRRAVSATYHEIRVWELRGDQTRDTFDDHAGEVTAVTALADGRHAVSVGKDYTTVRVWDIETGRASRRLRDCLGPVSLVAVSGRGHRAVSAQYGGTLQVWDLDSEQLLGTLEGHTGQVYSVAVTPDARRAVSASSDGTLRMWDLDNGQELRLLRARQGWFRAVALTPDGCRAVASVVSEEGPAYSTAKNQTILWDLETGETLRTLKGHRSGITVVGVTSGGRRAVLASERSLSVYDLVSGGRLHKLVTGPGPITALAISTDEQRLVVAAGELQVWDMKRGKLVCMFVGEGDMLSSAIAPDGRTIVSGDHIGRVHFFRLEGDGAT